MNKGDKINLLCILWCCWRLHRLQAHSISGDFPSRMFLFLKMGKEFQLCLACISRGRGSMRMSQIHWGKSVHNQQGAGTTIPPFSLPIVTPSLLSLDDASSIDRINGRSAMLFQRWPLWDKYNVAPKWLWESDWVLTRTYCNTKIIRSHKYQYGINCKKKKKRIVVLLTLLTVPHVNKSWGL